MEETLKEISLQLWLRHFAELDAHNCRGPFDDCDIKALWL
jgi:hypothetical protein